jgi:hypothetical protein
MVCNLGPSDSVHNLDLTSEKKKSLGNFLGNFLPNFDLKNMTSIDTGEQMEQMAKIDQI